MIVIGESNRPTDTISVSLDNGKTFLNYQTDGTLLILDRIFSFDNNKIIAKKFYNFHFYNNEINKMHVSKKVEMLNAILDLLGSEKETKIKEILEGFLSKNPDNKGISDIGLIKADMEKRMQKIVDDILNANGNYFFNF
jgi:hypothetical protein